MDHYSYSKLDAYSKCPRFFKLRYIEKRYGTPVNAYYFRVSRGYY